MPAWRRHFYWAVTSPCMKLALWEWVNNWIYFVWREFAVISRLPESVDFVTPLMVLKLRADLFITTIVADPNAGGRAVIRVDSTQASRSNVLPCESFPPVGLIFDGSENP